MKSQNKNPKSTNRTSSSKRGNGNRSNDADSKLLQKISKNLGNNGIQSELNQRSMQRDQLLAFICHRLQSVQQVQALERSEMKNESKWFREIARGTNGFSLPQPTRWHECARLFKQAAQAFCQGNLGRGTQLLDLALEQEKAAYDSLPKQIESKLESKERSGDNAPITLGSLNPSSVCPSTKAPQELKIADQILNIRDVMEDVAPLRRISPLHWWGTEEDIEEEDQDANQEEDIEEEQEEQEEEEQFAQKDTVQKDQT